MVFKKSSGGVGSASNSRMNFASSSDFMIVILPMQVKLFNVAVQILNEKKTNVKSTMVFTTSIRPHFQTNWTITNVSDNNGLSVLEASK